MKYYMPTRTTAITVSLLSHILSVTTLVCPDKCMCPPGGKVVDCSDQRLEQVPRNIDPDTEFLLLSKNNIQSLNSNDFEKLGKLIILRINNNFISRVPGDTFSNLTQLRSLDLSENHLLNVNRMAFRNLPNLLIVELGANNLTKISFSVFNHSSQLQKVNLTGNPLQCTCSLRRLGDYSREKPFSLFGTCRTKEMVELRLNQLNTSECNVVNQLTSTELSLSTATSLFRSIGTRSWLTTPTPGLSEQSSTTEYHLLGSSTYEGTTPSLVSSTNQGYTNMSTGVKEKSRVTTEAYTTGITYSTDQSSVGYTTPSPTTASSPAPTVGNQTTENTLTASATTDNNFVKSSSPSSSRGQPVTGSNTVTRPTTKEGTNIESTYETSSSWQTADVTSLHRSTDKLRRSTTEGLSTIKVSEETSPTMRSSLIEERTTIDRITEVNMSTITPTSTVPTTQTVRNSIASLGTSSTHQPMHSIGTQPTSSISGNRSSEASSSPPDTTSTAKSTLTVPPEPKTSVTIPHNTTLASAPATASTATTPASTATATATAPASTATATATTPASIATATDTTPASTATATATTPASTATATATAPASIATATDTTPASTATATDTTPASTATATDTTPASTATATATTPASTATATATTPASTATATDTTVTTPTTTTPTTLTAASTTSTTITKTTTTISTTTTPTTTSTTNSTTTPTTATTTSTTNPTTTSTTTPTTTPTDTSATTSTAATTTTPTTTTTIASTSTTTPTSTSTTATTTPATTSTIIRTTTNTTVTTTITTPAASTTTTNATAPIGNNITSTATSAFTGFTAASTSRDFSTTSTPEPDTLCATVSYGEQLVQQQCAPSQKFCKTFATFQHVDQMAGSAQVGLDAPSCQQSTCLNEVSCLEDMCNVTECCQGNLCNQPILDEIVTNEKYPVPDTYSALGRSRLIVASEGRVNRFDVDLLQYLNSRAEEGQEFTEVAYSTSSSNQPVQVRCAPITNSRQQCFHDFTIVSVQQDRLPPLAFELKQLINSDEGSRAQSLIGAQAILVTESYCRIGNQTLSLGYSRSMACEYFSEGNQVNYKQYWVAMLHSVVDNREVVLGEENVTVCPSANTGYLEESLATITKETASGIVRNVSRILTPTDNSSSRPMSSRDIELVVDILNETLGVAAPSESDRESYMSAFNSIQTVDEASLKAADEKDNSVQRLIENMEKFSDQVVLDSDGSIRLTAPNLTIASVQMSEDNEGYKFVEPFSSTGDVQVVLPASLTTYSRDEQPKRLNFIVYKSSRLFEVLMDDANDTNGPLNSWIISAQVGTTSVENLQEPVGIMLPHDESLTGNQTSVCAFWDWKSKTWATEGVIKYEGTINSTQCRSTHLTNFALLLDVNPYDEPIDATNAEIFTYISYIGCGISLIGILITMVTYLMHRKLRKDNPSKILLNLCVALGLLNVIFLSLAHLKDSIPCAVTGALLHYSLLASFSWMAVEAFYMYIALVLVFSYIKRFMLKVMLVGWGVPLVIVAITIGHSRENYKLYQGQLCWLDTHAFFGAVLAPVAVVLIANCVAFVLVVKQLRRVTRRRGSTYSESYHEKKSNMSMQLRGAASVFVLLGLTWSMAGLAAIESKYVFTYLFTIFNSLQGFFLFIFYCVLKRDAQLAWMRTCPCFEYDGGYTSSVSNKLNGASQATRRTKASSRESSGALSNHSLSKPTNEGRPHASSSTHQWNLFRRHQSYEVKNKGKPSSVVELQSNIAVSDSDSPSNQEINHKISPYYDNPEYYSSNSLESADDSPINGATRSITFALEPIDMTQTGGRDAHRVASMSYSTEL